MKILSFIPWAGDGSPHISSCLLDSDSGNTMFSTSPLNGWERDDLGIFVPKPKNSKSALCPSLDSRIEAENPDEIVTYFELGLWRERSQKSSIYPPKKEFGTAILRHTIDSPKGLIENSTVLTHENVVELFGWEEAVRAFDAFSAHLIDENIWERFCFSLCLTNMAWEKHQQEVAADRLKAHREKTAAEERAREKHHEQSSKVANAKSKENLEKMKSFDL